MIPHIFSHHVSINPSLDDLPLLVRQVNSEPVALSFYDGMLPPSSLATEVFSFWNDDHLSFLFRGAYGTLKTAPRDIAIDPGTGRTFLLWEHSDVYEVFIGPDARNSSLYREFQVAPDSRWIDVAIDGSREERVADFQWNSGMKSLSRIDGKKKIWESVFHIPFTAFARIPRGGERWNANFYRISGEPGDRIYLSWCPVFRANFHQPEFFGDIVFLRASTP